MRADALNLHVYPLRTEMTATKQIPISRVCSTNKSKLKGFLVDETLSGNCSKDEEETKGIIVNERFTKEAESDNVHKTI